MATFATLVITGTEGNDELIAIPSRPWTGLDDDNLIEGLGGNDRINGAGGLDTARFSGPRGDYVVFRYDLPGGLREAVVNGPDGIDALHSVEFLEFAMASGPGSPLVIDRAPLTGFGVFPAFSYLASWPDLTVAIGANPDRAWAHFRDVGAPVENRAVTFSGLLYVASHADLAAVFGRAGSAEAISEAGARHFVEYGRAEGRTVTFSGLQYVAGHDDLAEVFGGAGDADAIAANGAWHFIAYGLAEGRAADAFDDVQYLANNPDLVDAGVDTPDAAALHFILFGRAEGRTDAAPVVTDETLIG